MFIRANSQLLPLNHIENIKLNVIINRVDTRYYKNRWQAEHHDLTVDRLLTENTHLQIKNSLDNSQM